MAMKTPDFLKKQSSTYMGRLWAPFGFMIYGSTIFGEYIDGLFVSPNVHKKFQINPHMVVK